MKRAVTTKTSSHAEMIEISGRPDLNSRRNRSSQEAHKTRHLPTIKEVMAARRNSDTATAEIDPIGKRKITRMSKLAQPLQMVDLKGQYLRIKPEIDAVIQEVIDTSQFIGGQAVKNFAAEMAAYLNVKHVIPCANGTDALQIALMALGIQPGDEVITTPFTFVATVEAAALLGAKPVFVDIHPDTFNINEELIEAAITPRTKAIVPVHLFGQCANMPAIMDIARKHQIPVIEDNAQAIGASIQMPDGTWQKAGCIGDIGTTSFFPAKNLGCYGDGGAIFTNNDELAQKLKLVTDHGSTRKYYYESVGVNSRLDGIQAAVLRVKLPYLDGYAAARQAAAARYNELLANTPGIVTPPTASYSEHVWHQYTLQLSPARRGIVQQLLAAQGIPSAIYYPVPLHVQEAYRHYGYQEGDFPVTEEVSHRVLSLPMHTELTADMQTYICEAVKEAMLEQELA
jgi:dTDP-4-amino-4,6-dideoxygalactose transaminase